MHILDATKLLALAQDQYGQEAARLVILGRGDEFAVRIAGARKGCWFCWNFADWTDYRKADKKQAQQQRKHSEDSYQVQGAIDYSMQHTLLAAM